MARRSRRLSLEGPARARSPRPADRHIPKPWQKGEYTITPLASYEVTALVLAREDYSLGREADLSPMDLALGWSTMSEENIVKGLEVSQSNRWYHYHWDDAPPMSPEVIARNSSNHHLIPATPEVAAALAKVRRHSLVTLKGHLVEVTHGGGWKWRSSLSRTDTGGGACEILWVEEASVGKP